MKILGIDTSSYANAVGVIDGGNIISDLFYEARTDSLEKILSNIDIALKEAGISLQDIDGIGVGLGPGSWTGIRVGVTVGKILAFSAGKPLCGVPTMEALAYNKKGSPELICPVISAGTGNLVYAGFYRWNDGILARDGDYYIGELFDISNIIKENTVIISSRAKEYQREISGQLKSQSIIIDDFDAVPSGAFTALSAMPRFERGERDDTLALEPLYLKESTAKALSERKRDKPRVISKD